MNSVPKVAGFGSGQFLLPECEILCPVIAPQNREAYVVIPARYASTRLPRKMLLRETGKTLLQHTYEAACAARKPPRWSSRPTMWRLPRGRNVPRRVVMTSPDCASGTDRVAEVARQMPQAEILVNVQGDEPEMSPTSIDR